MNRVKTILIEARNLVEKGWTKFVYARDQHGHNVSSQSSEAVFFCINGACMRCTKEVTIEWPQVCEHIVKYLPVPYVSTHQFNDNPKTTLKDVLNFFDRAIEAC